MLLSSLHLTQGARSPGAREFRRGSLALSKCFCRAQPRDALALAFTLGARLRHYRVKIQGIGALLGIEPGDKKFPGNCSGLRRNTKRKRRTCEMRYVAVKWSCFSLMPSYSPAVPSFLPATDAFSKALKYSNLELISDRLIIHCTILANIPRYAIMR